MKAKDRAQKRVRQLSGSSSRADSPGNDHRDRQVIIYNYGNGEVSVEHNDKGWTKFMKTQED